MHHTGTTRALASAMEASTKLRARRTPAGTQWHWRAALLFVASLLGCGGIVGSSPSQPPPTDITVTVAPAAASVLLGGQQPFAAAVGNTQNTAVVWNVNGTPGGNQTVGTIDAFGMYTAPANLPAPASFVVRATSVADPTISGAGTITIASSFSLAVSGPASVNAGGSATYTAALTVAANSNPSRVIFWSVAGSGCAAAACGTISSDGVYTAPSLPPSPSTVQIIATPQADSTKAAGISVSILPVVTVSISPTSATLAPGAPQPFQATVSGSQDATVTWDVNGIVGGNAAVGTIQNSQTDPNHTAYISPQSMPVGGSVEVRAHSNAAPGVSASATVTFTNSVTITLTPAVATLALGERQTFSVAVSNTPNKNVAWLVNGIPGGGAAAGQICVVGSNPCRPVAASVGGSVDYVAPAGIPSTNPVTIVAVSQASGAPAASAQITILPHVVVTVQPGNASLAASGQARFTATVAGTENQQVFWNVAGAGCANPGTCGSIDAAGLYTAPASVPVPNLIEIVATSLEDIIQSGSAMLTISSGPAIFSLSPTSAYAGTAGGFTLLVSGSSFAASNPGPGSTLRVAGTPRATSCVFVTRCTTTLTAADLASAANLTVQLQNPDGTLSNPETFVVLAQGLGPGTIPLTPSAPESEGVDIVVVELSTNGGSGAPGNVSLNIGAVGVYTPATSSCVLGGNPVVVQRPATGVGTADLCVFSISALDPSFHYSISGPAPPDITIINREPLGLGMLHLTLQVPATSGRGARALFVENPKGDKAAGSGAIEVQ